MNLTPADGLLFLTLAVACYTDATTGKIKNWLTFPMMAAGVILSGWAGPHVWFGLAGVVVALLVSLPGLFLGKALHPGDVKLLMAAGAFLGPERALRAVLFTYVLGLPFGVVMLAIRGRLGNLKKMAKGEKFEATRAVYGFVVAAGVLLARFTDWPKFG